MKKVFAAALMMSSLAFAVPGSAPGPTTPPAPAAGAWANDFDENGRGAKVEEREKRMRMMLVVGIADALSLNEGEAVRLADRIKAFDERRRPLRTQMFESMKTLKAAADGDAAALPQVDATMQKVLDGRAQMAAIDKEMFFAVSKDLTPQKKAQLAMFLARFNHEGKAAFGKGGKGRGHHRAHGQQMQQLQPAAK